MKKNRVRCIEGHIYDPSQHEACPICGARPATLEVKTLETDQSEPERPKEKDAADISHGRSWKPYGVAAGGLILAGLAIAGLLFKPTPKPASEPVQVAGKVEPTSSKDQTLSAETPKHAKPHEAAAPVQNEQAPAKPVQADKSGSTPAPALPEGPSGAPAQSSHVRMAEPSPTGHADAEMKQPAKPEPSVKDAAAAQRDVAVAQCDQLAASDVDPDRASGVAGIRDFKAIDASAAIAACKQAVEAEPASRRLWFQLGRAYRAGKDDAEAAKSYRKADELGSPMAAYALAGMSRDGAGMTRDLNEYRRYLRIAAERGFVLGMTDYGRALEQGVGGPANIPEARRFYERAVERGNVDAAVFLGSILTYGATEKDFASARVMFQRAADAGDHRGLVQLAYMHQVGLGGPKDDVAARRLYDQAAAKGNVYGMRKSAEYKLTGTAGPKDIGEARRLLETAANAGDADSMLYLAYAWREDTFGERNAETAVQWMRKAADRGNAAAMNDLGAMYATGEGVQRDLAEARKWYERASNAGNMIAMTNLGFMYKTGQGIPQDYAQAWRLLERAASLGDARAMVHMGDMTQNGLGVAKDLSEARNWFLKAAQRGNADAGWYLAIYVDRGIGTPRDPADAANRAVMAFKQGSADARQALLNQPEKILSGEAIAEIQRYLGLQGFYPGPLSGRLAPAAREGLQRWAAARQG